MNSAVVRRTALSLPGAMLLSVILASQAMAATWSAPMPLTSSGIAFAQALATIPSSSTALALYTEHDETPGSDFTYSLKLRRSTTSGASWNAPITLTPDTINGDISALGSVADVVWDQNGRIRYARSMNGGQSFGASIPLSPVGKSAWNPSVARGPNGRVAVVWENLNTGVLWVRVSGDGGNTFNPQMALGNVAYDMGVEVAVGQGVIYVAYHPDTDGQLRITRSTNGGTTWSVPEPITDTAYGVREQFSITAVGSHAYIAYSTGPVFGTPDVKLRRTTDKGVHWSNQAALSPGSWESWGPNISLQGGVVRAVFTRRGSPDRVYYRQSNDGVTWAASEKVAQPGYEASVGFATKIIVLYRVGTGDAFVATGTP